MKRLIKTRNKNSKGQSFVEFALITIVLSFLVFGMIQFAHMASIWTRLAAVVREGARSHVALNYGMEDYPTDSFTIMEDMIKPGKVDKHGGMIISIVRREGDGSSTDKMYVRAQYIKNAPGITFSSKLGVVGTEVPDSVVSIDMVTVEQTVVVVEVYYDFSRDIVTPVGALLENTNLSSAYERAFF